MTVEVVDAMKPHPARRADGSGGCATVHAHRYRAGGEAHRSGVEVAHEALGRCGRHGEGEHGHLLVHLLLLALRLWRGAVASVG